MLPSTFTGGPRYMHQLYQDTIAIARKHGKPDLFITMTCNPKWPEIQSAVLPGQTAVDRPDLITAHAFRLRLRELLTDLLKRHALGHTIANAHTIEFQKRGLPHARILLILAPEDKLQSTDDYDSLISAELPDKDADPDLY